MENLYELKEKFLAFWNEENVKKMTLEEYTNLERDNSFCYWLESKTYELGSIWGGSAYKFGIYKRSDISKAVDADNRVTKDGYAWFRKYGETKEEAFSTIKNIILDIIKFVKQNKLEEIDKIDLGFAYKWKIAFLYSNFNILNMFKYEAIKLVAENHGFSSKKKISTFELQNYLINAKPKDLDYFNYTHKLWKEFEDFKNGLFETNLQKQTFINWLIKNRLNPEIAEELESISEDVTSRGYFEKSIYECINLYDVRQLSFESPMDENWDNLYDHYYNFILFQIKEKSGINLFRHYGLVTVSSPTEYEDFIKNNYWSGHNKKSYENYVNRFNKGSQIAIYYRDKNLIKVGAIGTVIDNPKNGFELKVKWNVDFEKFSVELNSNPNSLDFFQIIPEEGEDRIEDIKNIFYKIKDLNELVKQPLNQILFGAPGTGKTYLTKKLAVEIIDNLDYTDSEREYILRRYDELFENGQINFITFHQSINYEDFIEGIKPVLSIENEDSSQKNGNIEYEIKDGIFKKMSNTAKGISGKIETTQMIDFHNKNFFKMSLGGKHRIEKHNWAIENNLIFLGWGGENNLTHLNKIKDWKSFRETFKKDFPELVSESKYVIQAVYTFQNMKIGDIVIISKGNKLIDAIGIIESDYFYDDTKDIDVFHFRKVRWLAKNMNATAELFVSKGISQQTIYQFYNQDIKLEAFVDYFNVPANDKEYKRYVLIIDEINRGNISSVFGELITLIETEKRKGIKSFNPEFIEVELPYSNEKFSVPDNLYLIGTMNTADRSVEALDTALRRRFSFVEMQPKPEILSTEHITNGILKDSEQNEINLISVLKSINERIELLIDKDHQIGHSFFIKAKTIGELKLVFKDSIIPLLEEYFFGDFGKIGLVLGGNFIKPKVNKVKFPSNFNYGNDGDLSSIEEKVIFEITPIKEWTSGTFKSIYE
jgi:5-methylcytosine-specific restriction endonuclease McrBC GTP-binding regulatory subunit McrB